MRFFHYRISLLVSGLALVLLKDVLRLLVYCLLFYSRFLFIWYLYCVI